MPFKIQTKKKRGLHFCLEFCLIYRYFQVVYENRLFAFFLFKSRKIKSRKKETRAMRKESKMPILAANSRPRECSFKARSYTARKRKAARARRLRSRKKAHDKKIINSFIPSGSTNKIQFAQKPRRLPSERRLRGSTNQRAEFSLRHCVYYSTPPHWYTNRLFPLYFSKCKIP